MEKPCKRIDRVWSNELCQNKFVNAIVHNLPQTHSDHHLVLMCYSPPMPSHAPIDSCFLLHGCNMQNFEEFLHDA